MWADTPNDEGSDIQGMLGSHWLTWEEIGWHFTLINLVYRVGDWFLAEESMQPKFAQFEPISINGITGNGVYIGNGKGSLFILETALFRLKRH